LTRLSAPHKLTNLSATSHARLSDVAQARDWLSSARSIAVLTGAGISAESGLATFRGPGGLWNNHRPEDLASPDAFARDPKLVWEWYDSRRQRAAAAQPNPGHRALAALESHAKEFTLITQNVDGLHTAAGSRNVIELHGCLWRIHCIKCSRSREERAVPLTPLPPHCDCGALMRPSVVWFGESLNLQDTSRASVAAQNCDVFLVCGTSALVYPAAEFPRKAVEAGARVIEINIEATPFTNYAHLSLRGKCGELLPQIIQHPPRPEPLQ